MTDNDRLIWTGEINDRATLGQIPGPVGLYDTTLRDGEQTVGVVLDPDQKVAIAHALDELGVNRIEAGFPRVSEEDATAVRRIAEAGLRAEIWGFSRAVPEDVEALLDVGVTASVIESPISDMKLDALGVSHDEMLLRITRAVSHATDCGVTVAFFGVDGSRADEGFFDEAYAAAVDAGAAEVVVVDTLGIAAPEAAAYMVARTRKLLGPGVPVHWHGHNDFGLATAAALAALQAGASWIHGTVNGMGERAGNANLAEVALALRALHGVETGLRLDTVREVSALVSGLCGYAMEPWKPLVGENLFTRESGTVASQFHNPPAIEPYSADLVGAARRMVLGKKSGIDSIRIKLTELGRELPEDGMRELLAQVKDSAQSRRGLVPDDEFARMVDAR